MSARLVGRALGLARVRGVRAIAVLAVLGAAVGVAVSSTGSADAGPAQRAGIAPAAAKLADDIALPADCKPTDDPPPTEYGFVARITKGSVKGGRMSIEGLTAHMCGIIRIVSGVHPGCKAEGELIIPTDGVIFPADLTATLNVVPGIKPEVPTTVQVEPVEHVIDCNTSSKGGLKLDLAISVNGKAGAFGLECAIPFSGIAHTEITGDLLSGDYKGDFTMTGDDFRAGRVSNNDAYCPGYLPRHVNKIADLPGKGYRATLSGEVAIYQP